MANYLEALKESKNGKIAWPEWMDPATGQFKDFCRFDDEKKIWVTSKDTPASIERLTQGHFVPVTDPIPLPGEIDSSMNRHRLCITGPLRRLVEAIVVVAQQSQLEPALATAGAAGSGAKRGKKK